MTAKRLSGEQRAAALSLAVKRIERGRAKTKAKALSIAAVAREAGVTPALIHNCHPEIAEYIRERQGRSSRAQRDAKHSELKAEKDKNRLLQAEVAELRSNVSRLASINEVMALELSEARAKLATGNVTPLR